VSRLFLVPPSVFLFLFLAPGALLAQEPGQALYVGVRSLPVHMSPALAFTYVERQVIDLIFERLVEPVEDEQLGQHFRPRLAERLPPVTPLSRTFRLRPDARWPDGQPVTFADVRHTVQKLKGTDWRGRSSHWREGLLDPREEDDPAVVRLPFDRGVFEPLSLMSFPVLPQHFRKQPLAPDNVKFAEAPVGSGPYLAPERLKEDGREYLLFRANPHYQRDGKKPNFPEVRLFAVKDGAKEFRHPTRPMHLWLDALTGQVQVLLKEGKKDVEVRTLANRRVYFLAVNHRVPGLDAVDLRRALAYAIDREAILKNHFRAGKPDRHAALNGPFPVNCWAFCPPDEGVPATLYNFDLARSKLPPEGKKGLTLKYPDDDPRVARACQDIQAKFADLKIPLKLVALSPRELKEDVDKRAYELAYYHWDYPDETYDLSPLFDTSPTALAQGGSNFLGYEAPELQVPLTRVKTFRQFGEVQRLMRAIHAHVNDRLPLIPLWQLDTHVVVRGLNPGRLDAGHVFADVEKWKPTSD
jgi:peptide/nickel transport system substrate-binding protein